MTSKSSSSMVLACPAKMRERKTVRRSRFGCRNCKLRKLKCDERKPQCKRCCSFGILCNFLPNVPDLQAVADDSVRAARIRETTKPPRPLSENVWTSDTSTVFQLNTRCQDFVTRYLGRSLLNPNDPCMAEVNGKLLGLAFTHPFLMHASLAVAFAYNRYLDRSSTRWRSVEECYHSTQSIALFSQRLREPLNTKDRDPIWGTAAALALLNFSIPDAQTPEECWPLKPSEPSDLEWLKMNKGKMSLWHFVDPLRPDSIFHILASTYAQMHSPLPDQGIDGIPEALADVCHLTNTSTEAESPYFKPAHALSKLQEVPDQSITVGHTEFFVRTIRGPFESLLREKDPVALLLLYLWYRKASCSIWWIELRARMECPAICSYLLLYHKDFTSVHAFLPGGPHAS